MKMRVIRILGFSLSALLFFRVETADADTVLPSPVKTCEDMRAYIASDSSMPMENFKKLMTASGWNLGADGSGSLDMQCKLTAVVKNVVLSQRVMKKSDGSVVSLAARVVTDNG